MAEHYFRRAKADSVYGKAFAKYFTKENEDSFLETQPGIDKLIQSDEKLAFYNHGMFMTDKDEYYDGRIQKVFDLGTYFYR